MNVKDKLKFITSIVILLMVFACARRTSYDEAKEIYENNKELFQKYADDFKEQKRYRKIFKLNFFDQFYIPLPGSELIASEYVIYLETQDEFGYKRHEIELDDDFKVEEKSKRIFVENDINEEFFVKYAKLLDELDLCGIVNDHESDQIKFEITISMDGFIYKYGDYYEGKIINPKAREIKKIDDKWYYFKEY